MMFAKTFCKPGSYVEVAPVGLQAKLQYNKNGLLEKVFLLEPCDIGHGFTHEVDGELFRVMHGLVPTRINLKDGTTWVEGTFFTTKLPKVSTGNIAYMGNGEYSARMIDHEDFTFYAGNVYSLAASFKGPLTIRNWLSANGFKTLPGIIVPVEMQQETLDMLFSTFSAPFNPNFVAAFYIFEGTNDARMVLSDLYFNQVTSCTLSVGADGYAKGILTLDNNDIFVVNYSDAANFCCDKAPNVSILYSKEEDKHITIVSHICETVAIKISSYTCPICHKQVMLPKSGPCQCTDPNCLSVLYQDACKMLSKLSLPEMTYEVYREHVDNHDILCLTDILLLDNYKDIKPEVTLSEALSAMVPVSVVADESIFERFANSCNNSVNSMVYYLKNPNRIITELDMVNPMVKKFVAWISDPYNLTSVETLFSLVNIQERTKKFEGAPIFRSNSFVITGRFKRGSFQEIASILESYEATIFPDLDEKLPSAIITGSTNEDISGAIIKKARMHNVPIVSEDDFFSMYGIDADLTANLL